MIIFGACLAVLAGALFWLYAPDKPRDALAARYAGDYVEVVGIRLRVRDSGPKDAPAVILLHGFGSSLDTWDAWAEALSPQYRVIRYDLPGFGLTGPDPTGDYSEARGMAVLAGLIERLQVTKPTLIGNSIGGKLAFEYAAYHPGAVSRLVLVSPDGFASAGFEYGKPAEVPGMLRVLPYTLPRPLVRMSLAPAYGDPANLSDATVTRYRDLMLAPGVRTAMIARLGQTVLEDPEPLLRRLTIPVLLLWGEKDGMIPFSNHADYVRDLANCTLVSFPALGHVPQEEGPAESVKPVLAFLAGPSLGPCR